jgi:hypothetical protein
MWGPKAFDGVVKRIIQCISEEYGPLSQEELTGVPSHKRVLPFDIERDQANGGFKERKASLVKKIIAAFLRECLEVEITRID